MLSTILLYLFFGACSGILAGLLGGGGGIIIVPILVYTLPLHGIGGEHAHHIALGTCMATIVFTSLSSVRAHHQHATVLWPVVWSFTPGIILGTLLGGGIAARMSAKHLTAMFVAFLFYVSLSMFRDKKPKASRHLPAMPWLVSTGAGIGFISSFVGIGGGIMTVPFLFMCNVSMREAVGTSAGVTLIIAMGGAAAYVVNGLGIPDLPPYSLGFVYLPALLGLATASLFSAPLGAKLSYTISTRNIRRFFAVFLLFVGSNMLYRLFA